ncbi:MAG: tetratricopeptide repeat protein [Planctomycetales bacterium]
MIHKTYSVSPEKLVEEAQHQIDTAPDRAEKLLRQAMSQPGPRSSDAETALCGLLAVRGDWDQALPMFDELSLEGAPTEFLVRFGTLACRAGRLPEGTRALEEVRRRNLPESLDALEVLQGVYRDRDDQPRMLDCLRELARRDPGQVDRWRLLVRELEARHLDTEAVAALREALGQDLSRTAAAGLRHQLISRLIQLGNSTAAREELARLISDAGESPPTQLHAAALARLEGNPRAALETLQQAVVQVGENPGVIRLRGLIYLDLGRFVDAAEDFRICIEEDAFDPISQFKLAEAYRGLGQTELARTHTRIAAEIREKRQEINRLSSAARQRPPDRQECERLAELYRELNDSQSAARWDQRARDLREPPPRR